MSEVDARRAEIEAQLCGPGAPFETALEPVLGETLRVFKQRKPHLRALLEESRAHGDKEYLVYGDQRISYAEHADRVAALAWTLRDRFGVGPGDRVAICAANRPEWIQTFWATVSLGAVAVGLNGWWAGDEIAYALEDSDPRVFFGDRKRLARLEGVQVDPSLPVIEFESGFAELVEAGAGAALPTQPIAEDDAAVILYTSGTTGRPKGAVNTHRNVIALLGIQFFHGARMMMMAAAQGGIDPAVAALPTVSLNSAPLFHVSGLYAGAVTALATGMKTLWTEGRFDPVNVMTLIERERVTNWGPMGTMAYRVCHHPEVGRFDLSSIRGIGSGGSPMSAELQAKIREVFPNGRASMGIGYGLTESTALATLAFGEELERFPDSVGKPLPTVEVEIRDDEGKPRPEGEEGEVYLRGPLIMREYWRRPEATAETVVAGRWLRTGDWGRLEDGRLFLNSRRRDLILRGGENVYPVEIEHRIEAHPDVLEAAVLGEDDAELGQRVKAIVVPKPGTSPDAEALTAFVAERLAAFKVPERWEFRAEPLPRNATGKVLKHVLAGASENPFVEE